MTTDPQWRDQAACRDMPFDVFYPVSSATSAYDEARAACAICPVLDRCATDMAGDMWGFWAGTSPLERARLRPRRLLAGAWSQADDALVASTLSDQEVAARTGRTLNAVRMRRSRGRNRAPWTPAEDAMVTQDITAAVASANLPGRTQSAVNNRRKLLGYTPPSHVRPPWTPEHRALLDTDLTDDEIAARTGRHPLAVHAARRRIAARATL